MNAAPFVDASAACISYYCIRCDTLTDFPEFDPRREQPDY
jgi:hypothetical protein